MVNARSHSQRGSALILVLWISLLLSLILIAIITVSRSELRITKARQDAFLARNAAMTALETAAFEIATKRDQSQVFTSMTMEIDGYTVTVEKSDYAKKLDLNFASEAELTRFFTFIGQDPELAQTLAANIADWRDPDEIARPNGAEARDYVRARDKRRPANRAFRSVSELEEVLGITPELAHCAAAGTTVFGEVNGPDAPFLSKLYKKTYPKKQSQQTTTSLGTAARVTNAGGRYSIVATIKNPDRSQDTLSKTLGVLRVSGNSAEPYEWIVVMAVSTDIYPVCSNNEY